MIIFNAMVVYPLDGYRIVYTLLSIPYDDSYVYDLLKYISIINLFIIGIGVFMFRSLILGFILILLIVKYFQNKANHQILLLKNTQKLTNYFYFLKK